MRRERGNINFLENKKNINAKYQESVEAKKLKKLIREQLNNPLDKIEAIINSLVINNGIKLINATNLTMGDRAYNLQFSRFLTNEKFQPICFVISLLAPYYYYYIIDISMNNPFVPNGYKWEKNNGRNKEFELDTKFKEIINIVSKEIEATLNYKKFPEKLIDKIIPDISYQNIEIGNFTYFNAFFLNEYYCLG